MEYKVGDIIEVAGIPAKEVFRYNVPWPKQIAFVNNCDIPGNVPITWVKAKIENIHSNGTIRVIHTEDERIQWNISPVWIKSLLRQIPMNFKIGDKIQIPRIVGRARPIDNVTIKNSDNIEWIDAEITAANNYEIIVKFDHDISIPNWIILEDYWETLVRKKEQHMNFKVGDTVQIARKCGNILPIDNCALPDNIEWVDVKVALVIDNEIQINGYDPTYPQDKWTIKKAYLSTLLRKKEEETVSKTAGKMGVFDTLKSDAKEAGWRTFAKQIPKAARGALVAFMKAKGMKKSWIKTATEMMETEEGRAFVSLALGWALHSMPHLKDEPKAQALAKEWRVEAMATFGNSLTDELLTHFGPVMGMFSNLPEPPKMRVSVNEGKKEDSNKEAEIEAEAEMEVPDLDKPKEQRVAA